MGGKRVNMIACSILLALTLTGLLLAIVAAEAGNSEPREGGAIAGVSTMAAGVLATDAKVTAQASLSPSLLVDDFHDLTPTNELGGESGTYVANDAMITCTYPSGILCCDYDVSLGSSYALYWTKLLSMSPAGYRSLSFQVKGDIEGETARIVLEDCASNYPKLSIGDYTAGPITANWQQVAMSLVGFTALSGGDCLDQLEIRFDNGDGNEKGRMCLDNIWFKPARPPVVVDNFDDCQDPNALHGETGKYVEGTATMGHGYTSAIRLGDIGCSHWITYAGVTPHDSYAVWQTELKGLDASDYRALVFHIKGSQGNEKPNIYLNDALGKREWVPVTVTATTTDDDWQRVIIPLERFSTQGVNLANLSKLQIVFEWADMEGTVYLDGIQFVPHNVYLPIALKNYRTWGAYEDNDHWLAAYGPLVFSQIYRAYPDDTEDYYYFELSVPAMVNISVTTFAPTSTWGDLLLYGPITGDECGELIDHFGIPGHSSMSLGPHLLEAGKYYIRVYTANNHSTTQPYSLTVTY